MEEEIMKDTIKQIIIGCIVFIVGGLVLLSIIDPYIRNQVADILSSFGGKNILDVVKNPAKYEGKEILLKNAFITTSLFSFPVVDVISAEESDGNFVYLRYNYYRDINCGGSHADLRGTVLNTKSQKGLIPVDEKGNEVAGSYYFNVTEAKCRG